MVRPAFAPHRPYEPIEMSTAKWKEIRPEPIEITGLVFCQEVVSISGLLDHGEECSSSYCGDNYPHVVEWRGERCLSDGHHRVVRALILGQQHLLCRVLKR